MGLAVELLLSLHHADVAESTSMERFARFVTHIDASRLAITVRLSSLIVPSSGSSKFSPISYRSSFPIQTAESIAPILADLDNIRVLASQYNIAHGGGDWSRSLARVDDKLGDLRTLLTNLLVDRTTSECPSLGRHRLLPERLPV